MRPIYLLPLLPPLLSASPTPVTKWFNPLEVTNITCNDPADFEGHADIYGDFQYKNALYLCNYEWHGLTMDPSSKPLYQRESPYGVSYDYSISWVEGCETTVPSQDVQVPLNDQAPGWSCHAIFSTLYKGCT